jgi:hypothetical protein
MSAQIIAFVPRQPGRAPDETRLVVRARVQPDDLTMDHADTAPCEYVPLCEQSSDETA